MRSFIQISAIVFVAAFVACTSSRSRDIEHSNGSLLQRLPKAVKQDPPEQVALGRRLFFDKRLSANDNMACASCHIPEKGLTDGKPQSRGTHGDLLKRNTPHLYNLAWNRTFFWDGRVSSLEEQALAVLQSPAEMDMNPDSLAAKLARTESYPELFEQAFPKDGLTAKTIAGALSAFERSLISYGAPYDRYLEGEEEAMSPSAIRGMKIFNGKGNCNLCHFGPNLTDGDFHNTGVVTDDIGRHIVDRVSMKREFEIKPYPFFASLAAFKTPSLRNVALTAPYMHNGSEPTLEAVVRFYNQGGKNKNTRGLAKGIMPLNLSEREMQDLVAFLEALTARVEIERPPALP